MEVQVWETLSMHQLGEWNCWIQISIKKHSCFGIELNWQSKSSSREELWAFVKWNANHVCAIRGPIARMPIELICTVGDHNNEFFSGFLVFNLVYLEFKWSARLPHIREVPDSTPATAIFFSYWLRPCPIKTCWIKVVIDLAFLKAHGLGGKWIPDIST